MVKKLLFTLCCTLSFLIADSLDDKIKNLVDADNYALHQKLIDIIFKNRDNFYRDNKKVDVIKVAQTLKDNGLLKLFFQSSQTLVLKFETTQNPIVLMKIVNDSLTAMGYYFFTTKNAIKDNNRFSWSIALTTEYAIDPVIFSNELNKRNSTIENITKNSKYSWEYSIDMSNASISEAQEITSNRYIKLDKSIGDYWLNLKSSGSDLKLSSESQSGWYPYIAFYDLNLNLLGVFKKENDAIDSINVSIPKGCRYVKVSDVHSLHNIKNGFTVYLKGD